MLLLWVTGLSIFPPYIYYYTVMLLTIYLNINYNKKISNPTCIFLVLGGSWEMWPIVKKLDTFNKRKTLTCNLSNILDGFK